MRAWSKSLRLHWVLIGLGTIDSLRIGILPVFVGSKPKLVGKHRISIVSTALCLHSLELGESISIQPSRDKDA